MKLGTAGITGTQGMDINIGGSSIFVASRIQFLTGVDPVYNAITNDPTPLAKGDFVDVSVDTIHSGTAAIDLSVVLVFTRTKPAGIIQGAIEVSVGKGF